MLWAANSILQAGAAQAPCNCKVRICVHESGDPSCDPTSGHPSRNLRLGGRSSVDLGGGGGSIVAITIHDVEVVNLPASDAIEGCSKDTDNECLVRLIPTSS